MALVDKITAITQRAIDDVLVDNYFDSNVFFQELRSSNRFIAQPGGSSLDEQILFANNSMGKWYRNDDALNTTMPTMNTAAQYTFCHYDIPIQVLWTDLIVNDGPSAVLSIVAIAIQATEASMADDMGTMLFSAGANAKQANGLRLVNSVSNTIGGISQTTYSWWQAKVDSSTTVVTSHAVRNVISDCTIGKTKPNMGLCDRDMFDRLVDLAAPAQILTDPKTAALGFENVKIAGVPIYIDSHATSTHIFIVNTQYIKWKYSPKDNFKLLPFVMTPGQRVMTARLGLSSQVCYNNIRMQGALTGITG